MIICNYPSIIKSDADAHFKIILITGYILSLSILPVVFPVHPLCYP